MDAAALQEISDAVRLAEVDPVGSTAVLVEACARLTGESVTPAAAALADLDEDASRSRVHALVQQLREELDVPSLQGTELQEAAAAAMCRRHLSGRVDARELTYWVWRVVGLRGSERTRVFTGFEDEYTRFAAYDCSEIDADVTTAARAFLEPPTPARRRGLFRRR